MKILIMLSLYLSLKKVPVCALVTSFRLKGISLFILFNSKIFLIVLNISLEFHFIMHAMPSFSTGLKGNKDNDNVDNDDYSRALLESLNIPSYPPARPKQILPNRYKLIA